MCQASGIISMVQSGFSWGSFGMQQQATYQEMKFNKAVAEQNASMADNAARDAGQRGRNQEQVVRLKGGALQGEQKVALARAGLDTTGGSPLDILAGTKAMNDYDAQTVRTNAAREEWEWKNKAQQIRKQSELDERKAFYKTAGNFLEENMRQGEYGKSMAGGFGGGG